MSGRDGRRQDGRPQVAAAPEGLPLWLVAVLAAALALGLFLWLEGRRQARQGGVAAAGLPLPPAPPPLILPPERPVASLPGPVAPRVMVVRPAPVLAPVLSPPVLPMLPPALPSPAPPAEAARPRGGGAGGAALVVDLTSGAGASTGAAASADAATADDTARATLIRSRATVIPQGAIIAAVLETPLNSDRPGLARAIVGQDVRGFDGARVLIPRGSRLVGEFKAQGGGTVSRVLVSWTRLIRPDGVAIRIASPAADGLGGAGIPGTVNAHFLDKFASAVLQSALTVGVNVASTLASSGASTIYLGLPSQSSQIGQQLVPTANRAATVKVPAGAQIAVLVAHDLDFSGTPAVR